jgi:flagellar motility protein MotE (MotC chaperone)
MRRIALLLHRPRLVPALAAALGLLAVVKAEALWQLATQRAATMPPLLAPAPAQAAPVASPETPGLAERQAILEALGTRRTEVEARERAVTAREAMLVAAERRLARRVEELSALQQRLEALELSRTERDEAGWRGMVKLYEGMRPRDAARIFDDLEMPVLVQLVGRMREAKAAPVIGAMKPERARELTAALARHRAAPEGR